MKLRERWSEQETNRIGILQSYPEARVTRVFVRSLQMVAMYFELWIDPGYNYEATDGVVKLQI